MFIIKAGLSIILPAIHQVADGAPSKKISDKLYNVASQVPGVISIHNFRIRYIGNDLQVLLHIVVNSNILLENKMQLSSITLKHYGESCIIYTYGEKRYQRG